MRLAYVGDFINHGKSLQTTGTPLVILLSMLNEVKTIDVYCPFENELTEPFILPDKVKLMPCYEYNNTLSIFSLMAIRNGNYDLIIFNILPTGFGNKSLANLSGLLVPFSLKKLYRFNNVKMIYHNSVFTNNIEKLGYNSSFDKFRAIILGVIERMLFKNVDTFVLLDFYKEQITKRIGDNMIKVMKGNYLEAITTIYMNGMMNEVIQKPLNDQTIILIHGTWGPQKNLELALQATRNLRDLKVDFKLILSGGINHHFPKYKNTFNELLIKYSDVVHKYLGYVKEKDIMDLFVRADLVILPYNTPGGHSGVLEQAIFFDVPAIVLDFPEYREEARGKGNVVFCNSDEIEITIKKVLLRNSKKTNLITKNLIMDSIENISILLSG